jgi:glycosyltransferase involved in cell wall biosynthesis
MSESRLVAICLPTYKQARFLEAAVRSCYAQTYRPIEVWISDDASPDETPEVVLRLKVEFPDLIYHRHSTNLGMVGNYDWILRQPKTDYIAILDSDDVLAPRFVATLAALLDKYPQAGCGHVALEYIDASGNRIKESRLARSAEFLDSEMALKSMVLGQRSNPSLLMFRAEALKTVDYFRGRPPCVQDYDLHVSLAAAGYGNVYSGQMLGAYRCWGGSQWSQERMKQRLEGLVHIYTKTMAPAWRRRGWNESPLWQARQRHAADLVWVLPGLKSDQEERRRFVENLMQLSPSWQTRLRIRFADYWPYHFFGSMNRLGRAVKQFIKKLLYYA